MQAIQTSNTQESYQSEYMTDSVQFKKTSVHFKTTENFLQAHIAQSFSQRKCKLYKHQIKKLP